MAFSINVLRYYCKRQLKYEVDVKITCVHVNGNNEKNITYQCCEYDKKNFLTLFSNFVSLLFAFIFA